VIHITEEKNPCSEALPGFKPNLPVVFCGLYPADASQFEYLKDALAKLRLNDSSFEFEAETSSALGFGFRCGFLGLLASRNYTRKVRARIRYRYDHNSSKRDL
jgi:GTP-binding protein LepA